MATKRPTDFYTTWNWWKDPENISGVPQTIEQLTEVENTRQFLDKIDSISFKGNVSVIPMNEEMSSNVFKLLKILDETKK